MDIKEAEFLWVFICVQMYLKVLFSARRRLFISTFGGEFSGSPGGYSFTFWNKNICF